MAKKKKKINYQTTAVNHKILNRILDKIVDLENTGDEDIDHMQHQIEDIIYNLIYEYECILET